VFQMDVAKVDQDVAYVAMVVHVCCKRLSPMFHLFFKRMLQVCLFGCCIQFYPYVTSVLSGCCISVFASVSDACFKCFICLFCMLQVLHLNVSKVDRVLYMDVCEKREGVRVVPTWTRGTSDVQAAWAPM
jgi:hypothetical protein